MHCPICETHWRTKNAKGTRSEFSWKATLFMLAVVIAVSAVAYFYGDIIVDVLFDHTETTLK